MSHGYSQRLIEANKKADDRSWGVRLGRTCIKLDISVRKVAGMLGVSRATVYNWFNGETRPTRELSDKIEQMLPSIEAGYTQEV